MPQDVIVKARGLVTQYNPISVGEGALLQADNVEIRREGIIENRRGFSFYNDLLSAASQYYLFQDKICILDSSNVFNFDVDGLGNIIQCSGTYAPPSGYKSIGAEAKSNLYITTSSGVKAFYTVQSVDNRLRSVGVTPPLTIWLDTALGTSGWDTGATSTPVASTYSVAYRATITRTDTYSNKIVSAPSDRLLFVNNSGASGAPYLRVYIPSDINTEVSNGTANGVLSTDYLVKVYRTNAVSYTASSSDSGDSCGDEFKLVYSATISSTDLSNGYIAFKDQVGNLIRGENLYTNDTQEGILQANNVPPLARTIDLYKSEFMMYGNCTQPHRLFVTMISAAIQYNGGSYNKTVTVAGVTYTGKVAESIGSNQFQVFNTSSLSYNIAETAKSLCRVINRSSSNTTIYAYYTGTNTTPGQMVFVGRTLGASGFGFSVGDTTTAGAFSPTPATSAPTSGRLFSVAESQPNLLFYSKQSEVEAVPLLNYFAVGPSNKEILSVKALRDALIIITSGGVYKMTGDTPSSFNVTPIDLTVLCASVGSIAVLNNTVYMLSNQGVVSITDSSIRIVSHDIDPNILPLLTYSNTETYAYGISYESDHKYLLSLVTTSDDTYNTQTYVYNIFTQAWTRYDFGISCGIINSSKDKLYFSKPADTLLSVFQERKDFENTDYADAIFEIDVTEISGSNMTVVSTTAIQEGDVFSFYGDILDPDDIFLIVDSVTSDSTTYYCVMKTVIPDAWVVGGPYYCFPAVRSAVQYNDWHGGLPGQLKRVRECQLLLDPTSSNSIASEVVFGFRSELDGNEDSVTVASDASGWGDSSWGEFPWGGVTDTWAYRTYIPQRKVYCRSLKFRASHAQAFEKISIAGVTFTFNPISERTSR